MKKIINLDIRKERSQFAFAAVSSLLKALGGNAFDAELVGRWREIVGAYADDLEVASVGRAGKDGLRMLSLRVLVPAKITMLSYEAEAVRALVNKHYGKEVIGKVKVKR
ncbi:MAG: DUF721 domain-containing protein [Rickettsiales bacterium]|nr:DUF721 domain-containing protein [Rickettsiales bacterium]